MEDILEEKDNLGEGTPEEVPEELEGETSEKDEEEAAKPDWRAKANAMYAKYKATKEELEKLKAKLQQIEKGSEEKETKKSSDEDFWRQKVEFLLANRDKNYSEEEFNHIATVAKEFDISLEEAALLEEDYIQYRREKVEKEKKQLQPTTRTSPSPTPIEQIPVEKLKELTPEQREEWYRKMGIKRR